MSISFGTSRSPERKKPPFENVEFVPHAILSVPISYFSELGYSVIHSRDSLDEYDGTTFLSEAVHLPIAVRYYEGYPEKTSTVYLPFEIKEVPQISEIIRSLLEEFKLVESDIVWQRKDDPDL
jgi:hypothetical protein